jgi:hypothetical protein
MVHPKIQGAGKIILRKENFAPDFFDLRTGLLGEVLQKFVNYRVKLAVVGEFVNLSKNFEAVMLESNRGNDVYFANHIEEAVNYLLKQ